MNDRLDRAHTHGVWVGYASGVLITVLVYNMSLPWPIEFVICGLVGVLTGVVRAFVDHRTNYWLSRPPSPER